MTQIQKVSKNTFKSTAFALACAGATMLIVGCGGSDASSEPEEVSRDDFCGRWAAAACTDEVVSVCQASSENACEATQREVCLQDLPARFIDRGVDDCLAAVRSAYEDADLTAEELSVVMRYTGACSEIFVAGGAGDDCTRDADCEPTLGCVFKDQTEGSCQTPVVIEAGLSCSAPAETCEEGFFCDGDNCLGALEEGEDCDNDSQCGDEMYCTGQCTAASLVGEPCETDRECASGVCYEVDGDRSCIDRLRLSPSEPLCSDLK